MSVSGGFPNLWQSVLLTGALLVLMVISAIAVTGLQLPYELTTIIAITYIVSIGVMVAVGYRIKSDREGEFVINWKLGSLPLTFLVLITGLCISVSLDPLAEFIPVSQELLKTLELFSDGSMLSFVMIVLAPAILEELFFRGIILDGLTRNLDPWKAILVSSLLFGVIHMNYIQMIGAFAGGMFFGWIYWRTGSILYPILLHGLNNFIGWMMISQGSIEVSLMNFVGDSTIYYSMILVAIVMAGYFIFLLSKHLKPIGTT